MSHHPDDYQVVPATAAEIEIKDRYDHWNARVFSREAALMAKLEAAEKDIALKERVIDALGPALNAAANERDALRARIEAMEQQKPVGEVVHNGESAGMYDILEQGTLLYLAPGAQPAPIEQDTSVRKAWARFSNELHRSHDAPYPGMSEAFEQHFSQSFTDREWRAESATWAAAWKAAKRHEAQAQPAPSVPEDVMRDAERYRYLRARDEGTAGVGCWIEAEGRACDRGWLYGDQLDSAIDSFIEMLAAAPEAKP